MVCREVSGVLERVYWLVDGWAWRDEPGLVTGAVVNADVVDGFEVTERDGGLLIFSALTLSAAAQFFVIVSI